MNLAKNVEEMEEADWYRIVDVNLTSIYRCAKLVLPEIRKRGGGAVVNVGSTAGILAENRCAAYSASKGGVVLLTRNMAMDYARHNIRVNAVCPGGTMTPRIRNYLDQNPAHERMMDSLCPMKRFARPEEIAKPAVFLASDDASFITGASLWSTASRPSARTSRCSKRCEIWARSRPRLGRGAGLCRRLAFAVPPSGVGRPCGAGAAAFT